MSEYTHRFAAGASIRRLSAHHKQIGYRSIQADLFKPAKPDPSTHAHCLHGSSLFAARLESGVNSDFSDFAVQSIVVATGGARHRVGPSTVFATVDQQVSRLSAWYR